jgi:hypothetical protein
VAVDFEAEEEIRRGLLEAKRFCVMEGLEAGEVAAFERNEIWRQRLELEERKHEYAMQVDDMAETLDAWDAHLADLQDQVNTLLADVETRKSERQQAGSVQVGVNMMLIQMHRMRYGEPNWLPQRGPDGLYHGVVPDQQGASEESVERAIERMRAGDEANAEGPEKREHRTLNAELSTSNGSKPEVGSRNAEGSETGKLRTSNDLNSEGGTWKVIPEVVPPNETPDERAKRWTREDNAAA